MGRLNWLGASGGSGGFGVSGSPGGPRGPGGPGAAGGSGGPWRWGPGRSSAWFGAEHRHAPAV